MAKVSLTLSTKRDVRGLSEVLARFVGGKTHIYRLKTGIFVPPARWDAKAGRLVIPRLATEEQRSLIATQGKLDDLVTYLVAEFSKTDPEFVDKAFMQRCVFRFHNPAHVGKDQSIYNAMGMYDSAADVSEARRQRYRSVRNQISRFDQYNGTPLTLAETTADDIRAFERFLLSEHKIAQDRRWRSRYIDVDQKEIARPRGKNTVVTILSVVRAFYHWAIREGLTTNNPFDRFRISAGVYGTPYYLAIEERDRVAGCNLSRHPSLSVQRDIFIFQCLVGCRVGDLIKMRKKDVVDGVLQYVPRKTKEGRPFVVRVPLTAQAKEIIGRYEGLPGQQLLPFISAQKYNDAIKRICLAARLDRPISVINPLTREEEKRPLYEIASSHLARRTFVGNLYRQVKDPNIVGSMSGHAEGSKAFARYRAIDDEMKREVIDLLDKM